MGMVVRTNTMAVNAYRQLNMNQMTLAKSLEKLASGFRINRAADDAAGLAISEKMKAQIVGLEAASANALDGISLVQTAEGALTEVHNMLNRMVYLATKSANGTYDDTVDRKAIQLEVDALLAEIDRISQSANFNGVKLLDGSLSTKFDEFSVSSDLQRVMATARTSPYSLLDGVQVMSVGSDYVAATSAEYRIGGLANGVTSLPTGLTDTSTAKEIAEFFGINQNDYFITPGDAGVMTIEAKRPGIDPNRDMILTKAQSQADVVREGAEAYFKPTLDVNSIADTDYIGKTITVNGKTYTFKAINDWNADESAKLTSTSNGARLADGTYAIMVTEDYGKGATPEADLETLAENIALAINNVEFNFGNDSAWDAATGELITYTDTFSDAQTVATNTVATGADTGILAVDSALRRVVIDPMKFGRPGTTIGGGLTLQIGDTADDYNKVTVSVDDLSAKGMGLAGLKVDTEANAAAAIDKIRAAINQVSTNRASLGALQNRLEYTINNLDVMAENMMAANSRIRDTDMAKEMMTYTKMNILVQAATAMLAQANMQPQSILQLLQ